MNGIGQNFDDFLKEQGMYEEVNKMILEKLAEAECEMAKPDAKWLTEEKFWDEDD